ncbi:MAG: hypothetical protein AAFR93_11320, partial [Pseudomonadota bacterium]
LLGAAAGRGHAAAALDSMPQDAAVLNVTARHNAFYDQMFTRFAPAPHTTGGSLARGLDPPHPNWVDVQLDAPSLAPRLGEYGHRLGTASSPVCHWGFYLRPGAMGFYADVLRRPHVWSAHRLRTLAAPQETGTPAMAQRWGLTRA